MKRPDSLVAALLLGLTFHTACLDAGPDDDSDVGEDADGDGKADSGTPSVPTDNLNGMWKTTVSSHVSPNDSMILSWPAVGIVIQIGDKTYSVTRSVNKLTGTGVTLDIKPNKATAKDDVLEGTIDGKKVKLARDVAVKPTITLTLPGDRAYRAWLEDTLMPAAQQDRESYIKMDADTIERWIATCELYKAGSWQRKYLKGATRAEQDANFNKIIEAIDGLETTPRALIKEVKFTSAVKEQLKDQSLAGLALTNFNLYFTTGAGRAIHLPITDKSMAYFITDRPSRADKLGLVVMDTPSHGPLASTFGRQLLDMGAMPATDNSTYARTMMELLAKSDRHSAAALSGVGQSALTDWFAVMAIEDYRGVAFGNPDLGWGYNMTNVQFFGLVARSLARPTQKDSKGKPILGQVIVGSQLEPGDPSYADVLNGGNDMQEYADMAKLKKLATDFLRSAHPAEVAAVESAFAGIVPATELDSLAKADIFHFICAQLYDTQGRSKNLKGAAADRAVTAVVALFDALNRDSAAFEAYILAHGVTKSNTPAPKATGF